MPESNQLSYRVDKIQTLKFSFHELSEEKVNRLFRGDDSLELNITTHLNIEDQLISIEIITLLKASETGKTLVEHNGKTIFKVKGLDQYRQGDSQYNLPDDLMQQLFSLAYSHARALVAVEIAPTIYNGRYMLPVIDPHDFLEDQKPN